MTAARGKIPLAFAMAGSRRAKSSAFAAASSSNDEDYVDPPAESDDDQRRGGRKATTGSRGSKRSSARHQQGRGHPREAGASRERTWDSRSSGGSSSQAQAEAAAAADLDYKRNAGGRRSRRGDSSSQVQAEAAAAADLDYKRYDPQGRHYMQMLLGRLRLEGEANGRGAGRVNVERAWYFLEASAGNLALASDLYWVRTK